MKKKVFAVLVVVYGCCMQGRAQLKMFSIGPYIESGMPSGKFNDTNKKGIGAGLNTDFRFGKIGLNGSVGFMHFAGSTINNGETSEKMPAITAIPVRVGIKYYFIPHVYLKLESGSASYTNEEATAFILSPGIGIRLAGFDVQAKYETWIQDGSRSFVGLRAGYNF